MPNEKTSDPYPYFFSYRASRGMYKGEPKLKFYLSFRFLDKVMLTFLKCKNQNPLIWQLPSLIRYSLIWYPCELFIYLSERWVPELDDEQSEQLAVRVDQILKTWWV